MGVLDDLEKPGRRKALHNYRRKIDANSRADIGRLNPGLADVPGIVMYITDTGIEEFDSRSPQRRYSAIKQALEILDGGLVNGYVVASNLQTLHFAREIKKHGEITRAHTLCDSLAPAQVEVKDVRNLIFDEDRFCTNCYRTKRQMAGALIAIRRAKTR